MSGLEILGWIAVGFVLFFIIGCLFAKLLINILFFDELVKNPIKDFFYGLFTWQKKVPVYRDIGDNQFSNVFTAMFPVHHYEWKNRSLQRKANKIKREQTLINTQLQLCSEYQNQENL